MKPENRMQITLATLVKETLQDPKVLQLLLAALRNPPRVLDHMKGNTRHPGGMETVALGARAVGDLVQERHLSKKLFKLKLPKCNLGMKKF